MYNRGYLEDQYFAPFRTGFQMEVRQTLYKRWGYTAFAGSAILSNENESGIFPGLGLGLRFKMDRKANYNLRLDYALGRQSNAFYISFGEAF